MRRRNFQSQQSPSSQTKYVENEKITEKLLLGKPYSKEDLLTCAASLMEKFGNDKDRFFIFDNIKDIPVKNFIKLLNTTTQPIFVFYSMSTKHWALCCWIKLEDDDSILVLHKDSKCQRVNVKLERLIKNNSKLPITIIYHQSVEQNDNINSGPIVIRNLEIMLEQCKDQKKFITNFDAVQFCTPEDIVNIKKKCIHQLASEISTNAEFIDKINEFINDIPLKLHHDMLVYKKIMDEEMNKSEEDFDEDRIVDAKETFFANTEIKDFQEKYKFNKHNNKINLENEFPVEMKKLLQIFSVLEHLSQDEHFFNVLKDIGEILQIKDGAKVLEFYKLQAESNTAETSNSKPEGTENLSFTIPDLEIQETDHNCTSFDNLIKEVNLEECSASDKTLLKKNFHRVQNFYLKCKSWNDEEILNWTKTKKDNLKIPEDLCEAIAILDRGYFLITGGGRFRDTQILTALVFFQNNNQGKLVQIQTGEGKTVIIATLAIIRVLEGYQVDVITSNPVLAQDAVDEMKNFYHLFQVSVSTNNPSDSTKPSDEKNLIGYTSNVLYGTISNFQFDFLRECIDEVNIRADRNFDQVILDEVDSMLVDNGGYLAKISSPFPGMESLKYIYIKIWQELYRAEVAFQKYCEKLFLEKIQDLKLVGHDEAKEKLKKCLEDLFKSERKFLMDFIKSSNPTEIKFIPKHLQKYTKKSLEIWIQNAIRAKYDCHEFQQYRIAKNETGEKMIVPVDYMNTGVTLTNTIWSNGLHQFIQLKHNIHLTYESVTSSFISNIGYIKKYENSKIFGLSGTLGSSAERQLLSSIYNVTFARIPTYKPKQFYELPLTISLDEDWETKMVENILRMTYSKKRAVLVICETEADLQLIKQKFNFPIRIFANEDNVHETKQEVKPGDIILATNIAGRGTDFKTNQILEDNGGLHVIVGFLPCNQRVEDQAFGRTSRQGNKGSAQLIVRKSEIESIGLNVDELNVKVIRDEVEKLRLKKIETTLVKELHFKDELFLKFTNLFSDLQKTNIMEYVLEDLKEFWAFWLDAKNYKGTNLPASSQKEFDEFVRDAEYIIDGNFQHNPYYCILQANHFFSNKNYIKARKLLNQAIEMSSSDELNAAAYMKLFSIEIKEGKQFKNRIVNSVKNIFFLGDAEDKSDYKDKAKSYLEKAKLAISKEIAYVQENLIKQTENGSTDFVEDFRDILDASQDITENQFFKHIHARLVLLQIYLENINEHLKALDKGKDVILNGEMAVNMENLEKENEEYKKILTNSEVSELQSIGLEAISSLQPLENFPSAVINGVRLQLLEGVAALAAGLCFPPIFPMMGYFGGTCIADAITDVALELISQGQTQFNKASYIKEKCISQAISVVTLGISVFSQGVKIVEKAIEYCEKLSTLLRKCPYLKSICNKLANLIDRLKRVFQLFLESRQLSNKIQKTSDVAKLIAIKAGKDIGTHLCKKHVIKPLLQAVCKSLVGDLQSDLNRIISKILNDNKTLLEKLRVAHINEIYLIVDNIFMALNDIQDLLENFIQMIETGECDLVQVFQMSMSAIELSKVLVELFKQLENKLVDNGADNKLDELITRISERISRRIVDILSQKMNGLLEKGKKKFLKEGNMFEDVLNLTRTRNEITSTISLIEDDISCLIDIIKHPTNLIFEEIANLIAMAVKKKLAHERIHATSAKNLYEITRGFPSTLKKYEKDVTDMVELKNKILKKVLLSTESVKSIITHLKNNVTQTDEECYSIDVIIDVISKNLAIIIIEGIIYELLKIIDDAKKYFNSNRGVFEGVFQLIQINPAILNSIKDIRNTLEAKLRNLFKTAITQIVSRDESFKIILIRINTDELKALLQECVEVVKPIKEVYQLIRELYSKIQETIIHINELTNNVIKSLNNLIRDEDAPPRNKKQIEEDEQIVERLSQEIASAIVNIVKKAV